MHKYCSEAQNYEKIPAVGISIKGVDVAEIGSIVVALPLLRKFLQMFFIPD